MPRSSSSPGSCCDGIGSTTPPPTGCGRALATTGFIQLTGAIGYYTLLAMTVNACELEAAANAEVLKV